MKTYQGRLSLHHFDFYRLRSETDVLSTGFEDFLDKESVRVVEWAERFPRLLPHPLLWVKLQLLDKYTREIVLEPDSETTRLLEAFTEEEM